MSSDEEPDRQGALSPISTITARALRTQKITFDPLMTLHYMCVSPRNGRQEESGICNEENELLGCTPAMQVSSPHTIIVGLFLLSCSPYLTDEENQSLYGKCYHIHGHGHNYTGKSFTVPMLKSVHFISIEGAVRKACVQWHT